jgi:hypothetical protein
MSDFVESTKEASRGGFQGIKKIRGLLTSLKKVPAPDFGEGGVAREQIEFVLEDATILEMFPGEEEFELKDGRFVGWVPYAPEGKTPHANSSYMKVWVASAERLGKKPSDFIGEYVTLEKTPTVLFRRPLLGEDKKPLLDDEGNKLYEEITTDRVFGFVADETADSEAIKERVKALVLGLNQRAALRELLVDPRLKHFPEFKDMLNNGTLADYLGLVVVDGKFEEPEED